MIDQGQINANLFIRSGARNKVRIISISKVEEPLQTKYVLNDMQLVSNVLLGLHAYTYKGKVKSSKLMMKNEKYISTFASIGEDVEISTSSFDALIEFVYDLYGHKENSTDYVRHKLYTLTHGLLEAKAIPRWSDSLKIHTSRANYQAYIWRNC